jgi:alginate O-acetyltransferase complex protein AlgI
VLFNSFSFLAFFAVLATLYYAAPHRYRWLLLLAASLWFYGTFGASYLLLLGGVTGVTYSVGRVLDGTRSAGVRRALTGGGVVLVLSALLVFKYYDFFVGSVDGLLLGPDGVSRTIFPRFPRLDLVVFVGLSFYTFSCVSYLVDVYRRKIPVERHLGYFALYVSYFPKLLAGPIERAGPFLDQIKRPVTFSASDVGLGLQLMLWGLFKKVVIADHLAAFVDAAYAQPQFASPADLLIATYFFAIQLYCDFSGYSDMAIGASLVLGVRLIENFRRPYLSSSTREFWSRRWHLSLASWFRDYLYIPLGGSRVSRARQYLNVMVVFLASGLWHGANWTFVLWGGLNGLYNVVEDATERARAALSGVLRLPEGVVRGAGVLVTFHLVLVSWVFFRAASIGDAWVVLTRVAAAPSLATLVWSRITGEAVIFSVGLIGILFAVEVLDERRPLWERLDARPVWVRWGVYYAVIAALLVFGTWQLQSFVYMQF